MMVRKVREEGPRELLLEFPTRAGECSVGPFTETRYTGLWGKATDSVKYVWGFKSTSSGEMSRVKAGCVWSSAVS